MSVLMNERFNRTLKTAKWKNFYAKGTYNWINVIDQLVRHYNDTRHSTILMKSKDVSSKNEAEIWTTLPKFKVGDMLRVTKYKSIVTKGYEANFTEELFKIARVIRGNSNVYEFVDLGPRANNR